MGKNSCHVIIAAAVDEGNKVTNTFRKAIIIRQVPSTGLRTITNARTASFRKAIIIRRTSYDSYDYERKDQRREGYARIVVGPQFSRQRRQSFVLFEAVELQQSEPDRLAERPSASVAAREPQCRGQTNAFAPTVREKGHRAKSTHIPEMIENTTNTTNPTGTVAAGGKPYFAKRSRKFV